MANMHVEVTFTDWDNLSNDKKSFINFFMKDAELHSDNKSGMPLSLNIVSKELLFLFDDQYMLCSDTGHMNDCPLRMFAIPYCDQSVSANLPSKTEGVFPDIYPVTQTTSLLQYTSKLYSYELSYYSTDEVDGVEIWPNYVSWWNMNGNVLIDSPVVVKTVIDSDSSVNESSSVKPTLQTLNADITLNNSNLQIDYQLKTNSFYISYDPTGTGEFVGNTTPAAYYKMGIMSLDNNLSAQDIANTLKTSYKLCYGYLPAGVSEASEYGSTPTDDETFVQNYSLPWSMFLAGSEYEYSSFAEPHNIFAVEGYTGNQYTHYTETKVITRAIFPINLNEREIGLAYIQLYDASTNQPLVQNGTTGMLGSMYLDKIYVNNNGSYEVAVYDDMYDSWSDGPSDYNVAKLSLMDNN